MKLRIPGEPGHKARPRFVRIGAAVRTYTDAETAAYEQMIGTLAHAEAMRVRWPMRYAGPVSVSIVAVYRRPQSAFRKVDHDGRYPMITRPDVDNVAKVVMDGLNHSGVWLDDGQVCRLTVEQWVAAIRDRKERTTEEPCVDIEIQPMETT